jgi:hypothetical protein
LTNLGCGEQLAQRRLRELHDAVSMASMSRCSGDPATVVDDATGV